MAMQMDIAPMLGGVRMTESMEEWFTAVQFINHAVIFFKQKLRANNEDDKAVYLQEWTEFFNKVVSLKDFQSGLTWKDVKHFLHGDVNKYGNFISEMIKIVPPLRSVIDITWNNDVYTLTLKQMSDTKWQTMLAVHKDTIKNPNNEVINMEAFEDKNPFGIFGNSDDNDQTGDKVVTTTDDNVDTKSSKSISLTPSLQQQVQEMEEKLDNATKEMKSDISAINNTISNTIAEAIARAIGSAAESTKELKEAIKDGNQVAEKLSGDIKNTAQTVNELRMKTEMLKVSAQEAGDKAAKAYLEAKMQFNEAQSDIFKDIKGVVDSLTTLKNTTSPQPRPTTPTSTPPSTFATNKYLKYYADECVIDGETYQVCTQKFIEDATLIKCDSSSDVLAVYEQIHEIGEQYGERILE